MQLTDKLAEGKTKVVYAHPADPSLAVMEHKDGITAGDGARRSTIEGKGALSGRTTANVFRLLGRAGIPNHFVDAPEPALTVVRRCAMIPLEVVQRRLATGSFLRRNPEVSEGSRFDPPLLEFFLKDDARHDPLISEGEILAQRLLNAPELEAIRELAQDVFTTLELAWAAQDVTLVDLKIEFGRIDDPYGLSADPAPPLMVADVIDNDSWRIWPGGDQGRMLDKQVYRNAWQVDEELLDDVRQRYELVASMTDGF